MNLWHNPRSIHVGATLLPVIIFYPLLLRMMNFRLVFAILLCEAARTGWTLANDTMGTKLQFTPDERHTNTDDDGLPDRPLQLVRPDPVHHRYLELVPENVKRLHHVNRAVAVVAVVGKFHSGKSFLMNQLMGKREGFAVGPTVEPQTMGIWMWGKPLEITLPSGNPLSVIFLDTEGFAANNISESYDAKIFSVAALLSSYLIYNSVKIIDQADIDYLELLSRRTQLFALRSQVTKAQWFDQFNHDLLKFPPLLWVVKDFVQMTEGQESPVDWLRRIMETHSREDNKHGVNLLGIFDKVDCVTLFLPATTRALLQDVSKAREEDLTPEYRQERDQLFVQLKNGLVPKGKNGVPITGPELATLLEILVTAANEGSLVEIPGRWETFIKRLQIGALKDCITYYESNMEVPLKKHHHGAINESELQEWHVSSKENATHFLSQLLLGTRNTDTIFEELNSLADKKFRSVKDLNEKKIWIACSEAQKKIEVEAEEEVQQYTLPRKTSELDKFYKSIQTKAMARYKEEVGFLQSNNAYKRHFERLKAVLEYVFIDITLKNRLALEAILKAAINASIERFREVAVNHNGIPRTTTVMRSIASSARMEAEKVFAEKAASVEGESMYTPFLGHLSTKLAQEEEVCKKQNLDLIRTSCNETAGHLVSQYVQNTGPPKMVLPLNETELRKRLSQEVKYALTEYVEVQAEFGDTSAYKEVKQDLEARLTEVWNQAYTREVQTPLYAAKKLIMLSADKYDTEFSVTQHMKEVCLLNLDEGKAKDWQKSLKTTIVDKFIRESDDLQEIIASKRGWWSLIKGFFQWLASLQL